MSVVRDLRFTSAEGDRTAYRVSWDAATGLSIQKLKADGERWAVLIQPSHLLAVMKAVVLVTEGVRWPNRR